MYDEPYEFNGSSIYHYENMPMAYTKVVNAWKKIADIFFFYLFLTFAQNIDCGFTSEPPCRG